MAELPDPPERPRSDEPTTAAAPPPGPGEPSAPERPESEPSAPEPPESEPSPPERPTPEPSRRLAPGARWLWTIEALAWAIPLLIVASVAASALREADGVPGALPTLVIGLAVLMAATGVLAVPQLRWRRWRYEVREEEIDLRRGAFTVVRTLVPMTRVQHVDTRRTPTSQMLGLAAVVFHTAAGANEIPALSEDDAAAIRDRIADLARTPDDL